MAKWSKLARFIEEFERRKHEKNWRKKKLMKDENRKLKKKIIENFEETESVPLYLTTTLDLVLMKEFHLNWVDFDFQWALESRWLETTCKCPTQTEARIRLESLQTRFFFFSHYIEMNLIHIHNNQKERKKCHQKDLFTCDAKRRICSNFFFTSLTSFLCRQLLPNVIFLRIISLILRKNKFPFFFQNLVICTVTALVI